LNIVEIQKIVKLADRALKTGNSNLIRFNPLR